MGILYISIDNTRVVLIISYINSCLIANMSKKYVIVAFEEDEGKGSSIEVVPSCWLIGSTEVWWPSHIKSKSRTANMIKECTTPDVSTWQKIGIRVLGSSGK
jgi:hypothetical protein